MSCKIFLTIFAVQRPAGPLGIVEVTLLVFELFVFRKISNKYLTTVAIFIKYFSAGLVGVVDVSLLTYIFLGLFKIVALHNF